MSRMAILIASLLALLHVDVGAAEDNEGTIAFNKHCRNCHSFKEGDNRLAPSLYGIVGKKAGQVQGYTRYSNALNDLTWDEATLDKFIADPQSVAPGTNMVYPAVGDAAERKKIIDFLKSTSST